ncbi:hypothetical protein FOJ82_13895 [Tessaracoccus rhinocerotis]|uniref:Uncharacterized protein n=1 Tax=Tessaracoccus rhinocerotis TaxID=1689449 RepID=A0A553JWX9_9ACTN|nr:hypothetical protein [Tessaracoccus rhinocerotis]TRY16952.1 hypothetical protein FOJ82_13895 [Tessaracoccus rhinocerotis]
MSTPRDPFGSDHYEPQPVPRRSAESAPSAASTSSAPTATSAASAVEPIEVSGTPEGTPEPSGSWRKVTKAPAAVSDTAPVEDAGLPDAPPPIPTWVKWTGLGAVAILLLLALWLGLSLGGTPPSVSESPSPTVSEAGWPVEAPQVVGDLVRGEDNRSEDPAIPERVIATADYSDGTNRVALVLSRPEDDLRTYLADAGISGVSEVGSSSCGTSSDTDSPVCVRIVDRTAIMVVGLTEQSIEQLAATVEEFREVLTS